LTPKSHSSGKIILDICTYIACIFNDGFKSLIKIMEVMNLTTGTRSYNFAEPIDNNRDTADHRISNAAKAFLAAKLLRHQAKKAASYAEDLLYGIVD